MRLTYHSSGAGTQTGGRHNDRTFNLDKANNIDSTRTEKNLYVARSLNERDDSVKYITYGENKKNQLSFDERERKFYEREFKDYMNQRNKAAKKNGHPERCIDADKMRHTRRYEPRESIIEIGDRNKSVNCETLADVFGEFLKWHDKNFNSNIKTLNAAIHMDEATPHVHWRRVYEYTDRNGNKQPSMEQALKELGYERPDMSRPEGKFNNRQMTYTKDCRDKLIELCQERGIELETEPKVRTPNQQNLSKGEFLIAEQDNIIERQLNEIEQNKLDTRELIENYNSLVNDYQLLIDNNSIVEERCRELSLTNKSLEDSKKSKQEELNSVTEELDNISEQLEQAQQTIRDVQDLEERLKKTKAELKLLEDSKRQEIDYKRSLGGKCIVSQEVVEKARIGQLFEERLKDLNDRQHTLEKLEKSTHKDAQAIIDKANRDAQKIVNDANSKANSIESRLKNSTLEAELNKYKRLVSPELLKQLERDEKSHNRNFER